MKKLFLIFNLFSLLALPQIVFAQTRLPEDLESKYPNATVIILEEDLGNDAQIIPELKDKPLYRVTQCAIDDKKVVSNCISLDRLQYQCEQSTDETKIVCDRVGVIVGTDGINILKIYIATIYRWAASVVGIIAVLRIVIAGIQITTSQGAGQLEDGKNKIFQSIASIILLFISGILLWTINPNFFVG